MANKTKRTDIYSIDPRNIQVTEGFNSRVNFGDIGELAAQIKEAGMLNPITVQAVKQDDGTEKYTLVDGERRYRAVMKLIENGEKIKGKDIDYIKAIIVPSNLSKEELYVQQAMRNEGKNFNEFEWAILANKLHTECGIEKLSDIARMLGKNTGMVSYWLQILTLPQELQNLVRDGKLCGSDLRRMLRANNSDTEKIMKEVEHLEKKAQEKGEKTLSLKDLDFGSNTKIFKDTVTLRSGLTVLFKYAKKYAEEGKTIKLNIVEIHKRIQEGAMINELFEDMPQSQQTAQTA